MPKIKIIPLDREIDAQAGQTIMAAAHDSGLYLAHDVRRQGDLHDLPLPHRSRRGQPRRHWAEGAADDDRRAVPGDGARQ